MNKRLNVIENVSPPGPKAKSAWVPMVLGIVCLGALFWAYNHISGGCMGIHDVFTYCDIHVTPTKL